MENVYALNFDDVVTPINRILDRYTEMSDTEIFARLRALRDYMMYYETLILNGEKVQLFCKF